MSLDRKEQLMDIQAWCEQHRDTDCVIDFMLRKNIPLTREEYISHNYTEEPEWTAELEAEMPDPFRLPVNPSRQEV